MATTTSTWPPLLQYEVGVASVDQVVDETHLAITSVPLPGPDRTGDCGLTLVDLTRDDAGAWVLHSYGVRGEPGCASAELPPGFPTALCEDLPPVG